MLLKTLGRPTGRHLLRHACRGALLVAAAATVSACGSEDRLGSGGSVPPSLQPIVDRLDQARSTGDIGAYSFILERNGERIFNRSAGNLGLERPVAIASAVKPVAAAAILSMVEDDLLDLDAPIADYLDGTDAEGIALTEDITLRQLLNHTSGLALQPNCLSDQSVSIGECAVQILQQGRITAAGNFAYGGGSYQVAGWVASLADGRSWQEVVEERIAAPTGMATLTYGNEANNPRVAGGALASARDLAAFQRMIDAGGVASDGNRILLESTVEMMSQDNQIGGATVIFKPDNLTATGYSFGWWLEDPAEHAGSAGPEISAPGLFGTVPWIDLDRGYSATLVLNADEAIGLALQADIRTLLLDRLD